MLRTTLATMRANAPVGSVGNGGVALSPNRGEGTARFLDDLAIALENNAISRAKLIKLGGSALAASALGLFASAGPVEAETFETRFPEAQTPEEARTLEAEALEAARRRRHTNNCCISWRRRRIAGVPVRLPRCVVCCRRGRAACCGRHGCRCCRRRRCHRRRCRRRHRRRR
jgi:hypothetical protein